MQTNKDIHIGEKIKQVMKVQGRKASWLADQLGCERGNIYDIYKRQYIDTNLLMKISRLLSYDFFSLYSNILSSVQKNHTNCEIIQ